MNSLCWQNRLFNWLLALESKGVAQKHAARLLAGWLSLVGIRPRMAPQAAPSFAAIAGGGAVLICFLLLTGKVLNTLRPLLGFAGRAPSYTWPVGLLAVVVLWRYAAGAKLLQKFAVETSAQAD